MNIWLLMMIQRCSNNDVDDDEGAGQVARGRLPQQGWRGGGEGRHDRDDQVQIKLTQSCLKPSKVVSKNSQCNDWNEQVLVKLIFKPTYCMLV